MIALCYLIAVVLCFAAAIHATLGSVALFPLGVAFLCAGLLLGALGYVGARIRP